MINTDSIPAIIATGVIAYTYRNLPDKIVREVIRTADGRVYMRSTTWAHRLMPISVLVRRPALDTIAITWSQP